MKDIAKNRRTLLMALIAVLTVALLLPVLFACGKKDDGKPAAVEYTVTVSSSEHGRVTSDKSKAEEGETVTLTVDPDSGYRLKSLAYNGTDITSSLSFAMPAENVTVTAVFEAIPTAADYAVTVTAGVNGTVTISPSVQSAKEGDEITVSAVPSAGYKVKSIKYNDGSDHDITADARFTMPAHDVTVSAEFVKENYTVGAGQCTNGSVTVDKTSAQMGETITVTATPATGYELDKVKVNGADIEGTSFTMPAEAVTVTATFKKVNYAVTVATGITGGSVQTDKQSAQMGDTVTVTATPATGYALVGVTYNDGSDHEIAAAPYTFTMPAHAVSVSAVFAKLYDIEVAAGITNGTVAPSKAQAIAGETVTLTVTPDSGYAVKTLKYNGSDIDISGVTYSFVMPAENVTISATFFTAHAITVASVSGGNVTVVKSAVADAVITVTVTPDDGFELTGLKYADTSGDHDIDITGEKYTFTMPDEAVTLTATFDYIDYTVTSGACTNGSVSVDKPTAHIGETITVTANPDTGYELDKISVNGEEITGTTFTMPAEIVTVTATFKKKNYDVNVTTGITGGAIETDKQSAQMGDTVTVTVNPDTGYELDKVKVNGSDIEGTSFAMPAEAVTVTATFKKTDYALTAGECEHGSVSLDVATAQYGDTVTVTVNPETGYELDKVKVNGSDITGTSFAMPAETVTVTATFKLTVYNITKADATNGSFTVSAETATMVTEISVTPAPATGYELDKIIYNDGTDHDITATGKFNMPAANVTVTVTFKLKVYIVEQAAATNGSFTVSPTSAPMNTEITVTPTPATGYEVDIIKYNDGADHDITAAGKFNMPAADVTVTVTFKKTDYDLTVGTCVNGTVTLDVATAQYGDTITVTVNPETGYELVKVQVNGEEITGTTFTMPAEAVTVTATFKKTDYDLTAGACTNGSVSLAVTTAQYGDTVTVTVNPDTGYELDKVKVNGSDIEGTSFAMPAETVTVTATFKLTVYNITKADATNGSFTVSAETATMNTEITVTPAPATGYEVDIIKYNDGSDHVIAAAPYKFEMPASDVTVTVTFKLTVYNITKENTTNGSFTVSATATMGTEVTVTPDPDTGYEVDTIKYNDGTDHGVTDGKFTMPANNVTVTVTFKKSDYALNANVTGGGSVTFGGSATTAQMGDVVTVNITPDTGFGATAIRYGYTDPDGEEVTVYMYDATEFTMPASAVTVSVAFKAITHITDAAGFAAIANDLGGYYVLDNNINFDGVVSPIGTAPLVEVSGHSDGRSYTFDKAGTVQAGSAFTGVFDGNGYLLINYAQDGTSHIAENYYHGIFGYIGEGAKVGNFTLRNASVKGGKLSALVSGVNLGKIENVAIESDSSVFIFYSLIGCAAAYNGGIVNNFVCYIDKGTSNYGETAFTADSIVYENAEGATVQNVYVMPESDVSATLGDGWFYDTLVGNMYSNDSYAKYISSSATARIGEAFDVVIYRKNPENGDLSFYAWSGLNVGDPFIYVGYDAATHTYHEKLNTAYDFATKESIDFGMKIGGIYICDARTIAVAPRISSEGFGNPSHAEDAYAGTRTEKFINLVDGDPNSGVAFNTNGVPKGVYIQVDLVYEVNIDKLRLDLGRTSKTGTFVNGFTGHVELVGADGSVKNLGVFIATETKFVATLPSAEAFATRYIRIYMDVAHTGWSALSELYINSLGDHEGPVVVISKFGIPSTAGGFPGSENRANLMDGKSDVFTSFDKTGREAQGYVQIDFLEAKTINYLRVLTGRPNDSGGITDAFVGHVEYSADGETFVTIGSLTLSETDFAVSMLSGEEISARYIRVVMDTVPGGWAGIREILVNEIGDYIVPVIKNSNFGGINSGNNYNMFDGDKNTYIWFIKPETTGGTLTLDLLQTVRIEKARFLTGLPDGGDRIWGHVEYSMDGRTYTTLGNINEVDSIFITDGDKAFNARYLRIVADKLNGYMAIREIYINEQVDLSDRTYPIVTTSGFGNVHKGSADKLFDGDDTTTCWFDQKPAADGYIDIDLITATNMSSLRIVNGNDVKGDRIIGKVEVSADGISFTEIGTLTDSGDVAVVFTLESPQSVRYIRIKNSGSVGWTGLCEITVNPAAAAA